MSSNRCILLENCLYLKVKLYLVFHQKKYCYFHSDRSPMSHIVEVAKSAGCTRFFQLLENIGKLEQVLRETQFFKINIFCSPDNVIKKYTKAYPGTPFDFALGRLTKRSGHMTYTPVGKVGKGGETIMAMDIRREKGGKVRKNF